MDSNTMVTMVYSGALGITALACGLALGMVVKAAMEAISRQPEAATKIQTGMIIGCAFIEAIVIYVLISIFLIK